LRQLERSSDRTAANGSHYAQECAGLGRHRRRRTRTGTEIFSELSFKFGEKIFKECDPGNQLFIIAEGEVRISRDVPGSGEEALAVLKPGACFGEMAVLDRSERSTDAIASSSRVSAPILRC